MKKRKKLEPEVLRHIKELVERLSGEPRYALICAHSFVELLISILVRERCKNGKRIDEDTRTYPHSARLVILNELGILKDALFRQLDHLRGLRNDCVHDPLFELDSAKINHFRELGLSLNEASSEKERFTELLLALVRKTWAAGEEVFTFEMLMA